MQLFILIETIFRPWVLLVVILLLAGHCFRSSGFSLKKHYWFCGEIFPGACASGDFLPWRPVPGNYKLCVLGDHGSSN
jgi:hypothetical protein